MKKNIAKENSVSTNLEYFKHVVKPTETELKLHKDFLKREIKKNYFN